MKGAGKLSVSEYAALRGISDSYVRRLRRQGRLVIDGSGNVDVTATEARLREARDPARGGARDGVASGYSIEAAREKRATAQLRELELARLAGELVLAEKVADISFALARTARDALMSIPDRLSTVIAAEDDAAIVHAKLTAECRSVCGLLAGHTSDSPNLELILGGADEPRP